MGPRGPRPPWKMLPSPHLNHGEPKVPVDEEAHFGWRKFTEIRKSASLPGTLQAQCRQGGRAGYRLKAARENAQKCAGAGPPVRPWTGGDCTPDTDAHREPPKGGCSTAGHTHWQGRPRWPRCRLWLQPWPEHELWGK